MLLVHLDTVGKEVATTNQKNTGEQKDDDMMDYTLIIIVIYLFIF